MPVALLFETLLQNFSNELQYIRLLKSRNLSSTPPSLPDSPLYSLLRQKGTSLAWFWPGQVDGQTGSNQTVNTGKTDDRELTHNRH